MPDPLPTPNPSPSDEGPTSLFFKTPSDPLPPLPPSLSDPSPSDSAPLDEVPESDLADGFLDWGSGPPSTPEPKSSKAKLRGLRQAARKAVETVGGLANMLLTKEDSPEREVGLYVPDSDDVRDISTPLASLASRRMPEGPENPDVTDVIALVGALVAYGVKQKVLAMTLRPRGPQIIDHDPDAEDGGERPEPVDL